MTTILVLGYLVAIVTANLLIVAYGPSASIVTAFLFIGLDLSLRDRLHEAWSGKYLWPRMLGLVVAGSALSWLINRDAAQIATASAAAFLLAGLADAIVYSLLQKRAALLKMNGSNVVGSLVDSIAFPVLAFGGFLWPIMIGQFAAKVLGGFLWSLLITQGGTIRDWFVLRAK